MLWFRRRNRRTAQPQARPVPGSPGWPTGGNPAGIINTPGGTASIAPAAPAPDAMPGAGSMSMGQWERMSPEQKEDYRLSTMSQKEVETELRDILNKEPTPQAAPRVPGAFDLARDPEAALSGAAPMGPLSAIKDWVTLAQEKAKTDARTRKLYDRWKQFGGAPPA